jgi:hypothetical protein
MEEANQARLRELTERIAVETDHDKFTVLIAELNRLLDSDQPPKPNTPKT